MPGGRGRAYDVVVLGATGFTGRLMVEHLDNLVAAGQTKAVVVQLGGGVEVIC